MKSVNMLSGQSAKRLALPLIILTAVAAQPARAVVLQQKWNAGQQLDYDVLVNGTINVKMPPDAANILAGLPLDVELNVKGQTALDTVAVDEFGTGTIVPRVGQLYVNASMLGQKMELNVKDGKGNFTINGKAAGGGGNAGWNALSNPKTGIRISKRGRIEGIVPLQAVTTGVSTPDATTPNPPANTGTGTTGDNAPAKRSGSPINFPALVQSMMMRALPTVWPATDVNVGEKWNAEIKWPLADTGATAQVAPEGGATPETAPLGKFDFTFRGEEEVAGRKTQRIAVKGVLEADEHKAAALSAAAPAQNADKTATPRVQKAKQSINGDVWLDAAAGQVVRVELDIQSQIVGQAPGATPNRRKVGGDSEFVFAGTVQMQLRKVAYSSGANNNPANATGANAPITNAPVAPATTENAKTP